MEGLVNFLKHPFALILWGARSLDFCSHLQLNLGFLHFPRFKGWPASKNTPKEWEPQMPELFSPGVVFHCINLIYFIYQVVFFKILQNLFSNYRTFSWGSFFLFMFSSEEKGWLWWTIFRPLDIIKYSTFMLREGFTKKSTEKSGDSPNRKGGWGSPRTKLYFWKKRFSRDHRGPFLNTQNMFYTWSQLGSQKLFNVLVSWEERLEEVF